MAQSHKVLAGTLVALALALAPAGASASDPGVTPTQIVLGTTVPPGGHEAAVARGLAAYFAHVNARGGVLGRRVGLRVVEADADAAAALAATRQLVEIDRVFATIGGTSQASLAARTYLNRARVPQLLAASSSVAPSLAWTVGRGPTPRAEGALYGRFLARTRPRARVAVLAGDDRDSAMLLAGLRAALAGSAARTLAVERTDAEGFGVTEQVARLRSSGAEAFVVFAELPAAGRALAAAAGMRWRPETVLDSRSSVTSLRPPSGAVSSSFVKRPADPRWAGDPGLRLYREILQRYAPGASAADVLHLHGMAIAYTTVETLRAAGREPTRASLLAAARSLRSAANPFLLPGVAVRTSPGDALPVEQAMLERWNGRTWVAFGGLQPVRR